MYDQRLAAEILKVLNSSYPDRLQLDQLKAALPQFSAFADQDWLRAIDALQADGQIDGKFLRTGMADTLQDAAILQITAQGRKSLAKETSYGREVRLDPLLKIPDQGEFDHDFSVVSLAATTDNPLSLIVIDIDHFKNVNDTYGHEMGNEVLKQVAAALAAGCKYKGTVYRVGGDELAMLLQNYSLAEAEVLAERLRIQIAAVRGKDHPPTITLSIGVATFPEPVSDAKALFKAADDAMYTAKRNGRNQVSTITSSAKVMQVIPLTRQSLSVYMRTDERVRRLDEAIASHSGQRFDPAEDASLHVFEKAQRLQISSVNDLAGFVKKFEDVSQKLARCMVPTTPVPAGQSLSYVLDVAAAQQGRQALYSYFQSLKLTTTAEEYIGELMETLALF